MIEEYRERRDFICARLPEIKGVKCNVPQGAFYLVVKLPVNDADDFVRWLLTEFDIDGETVMLAPLEGFYQTRGMNEVRIGYVLKKEDLEKSVNIKRGGV